MDDLVYIAASPIHGKGLFAARRIRRGSYIGCYQGPPAKRDGKYVLWVPLGRGWRGIRGRNRLRYANHSSKPNAAFEGPRLYALKTIFKDQEITFDYGDEWGDVD